jgi:hypothetical protein
LLGELCFSSDSPSHTDTYAKANSYANANAKANGHPYAKANGHTDANGYANANGYPTRISLSLAHSFRLNLPNANTRCNFRSHSRCISTCNGPNVAFDHAADRSGHPKQMDLDRRRRIGEFSDCSCRVVAGIKKLDAGVGREWWG